jgi:hypothetical protein
MKHICKMVLAAAGPLISASTSWADTLQTHRIPAALAVEAVSETVAACARQGYRETAVVLDADGACGRWRCSERRTVMAGVRVSQSSRRSPMS